MSEKSAAEAAAYKYLFWRWGSARNVYGICREYVRTILEGTLGGLLGGRVAVPLRSSQEINVWKWNVKYA